MRTVARDMGVPLVDEYAAMRRWGGMPGVTANDLLAPDRLHLNDDGHRCVGLMISTFIASRAGETLRVAARPSR